MENIAFDYLLIFVAHCMMFFQVKNCGYVVDDVFCVPGMKNKKKEFKEGKRSVLNMLRNSLYGAGIFNTPKQEYLFTCTLHFINCCLIYSISGSLLAAILYLVNPVNNQTALWLNGRRYAVSLFCVLLAWKFKALALFLYPFAMWLHVSAMAFPLLFLTQGVGWIIASVFMVTLAVVVGWRLHKSNYLFRKSEHTEFELQKLHWKKSVLYVKSMGFYFFHCLFPVKPRMYHQFLSQFNTSLEERKKGYSLNFDFWKGLAVVSLLAYLIIGQHNFWALWFVVFISQWCNVVTVTMNVADRYCCIANVGLMVLLSQYISMLPHPYEFIMAAVFLTFYVTKYQPLFQAYTTVENFLLYDINISPKDNLARAILADRYLKAMNPMSAWAQLKIGLRHHPYDYKLLLLMAQTFLMLGKVDKGIKLFEIADKHVYLGLEEESREQLKSIKEMFTKEPVYAG